jgi:DNA-binding CsgD family transcriptional regulator
MNNLVSNNGISLLAGHLDRILQNIAVSVYMKDKDGRYLDINQEFVDSTGLNSTNDIVGKTDLQLPWASDGSVLMQQNDLQTISDGASKVFHEYADCVYGKNQLYISYKTPLKSHTGKIIGVFGVSAHQKADIESNHSILLDIFGFKQFKLTKRQKDCLHYLVRGMTVKQIAQQLQLSPRTVGHYLEHIKNKLKCSTRAELITLALQHNLWK